MYRGSVFVYSEKEKKPFIFFYHISSRNRNVGRGASLTYINRDQEGATRREYQKRLSNKMLNGHLLLPYVPIYSFSKILKFNITYANPSLIHRQTFRKSLIIVLTLKGWLLKHQSRYSVRVLVVCATPLRL